MKKIDVLVFTVTKILSSARKFEQMQFFYQLLKIDTWNTYGILFSVKQMTFFCRAVDIFEKNVEQLRFEQMHFEQLTLTRFYQLLSSFVRNLLCNFFCHFLSPGLVVSLVFHCLCDVSGLSPSLRQLVLDHDHLRNVLGGRAACRDRLLSQNSLKS
jgi:hypothetical protein